MPRSTCTYSQVRADEGCFDLAERCEISQSDLAEYNGGESFCDNLMLDQYVCCSAGTLPDLTPQPNTDGSCQTYEVKDGDNCAAIAESNKMSINQLEDRNKDTWGFGGCENIYATQKLCISTGTQPMPATIPNAVCGPQANGTEMPSDMSNLSNLNPCPLNACCNKWGQCGITSEFCTVSRSQTGAPGTSEPGTNGCISNCGTEIVNQGTMPTDFIRLGYYESFSLSRPCLAMRPSQIPKGYYTHLHYAFGNVTTGYAVDLTGSLDLFEEFRALQGVKRIMSFGGWAFSTEPATAPIFREGVSNSQRQILADNIAAFIIENDLDGVDFDWEYPGAPDIIPPAGKNDGANYLAFIMLVRAALPNEKTISIAAPASYWYLKQFPIKELAEVLDYIVYMTYDIHGQWDYDNKFANPGCANGNCLRSHVNLTEINLALSMITKAGVPTNKLLLGMALYGRSFKMSDSTCYTELCTFTGPESDATPGMCTGTKGYISNWEIRRILGDPSIQKQEYQTEEAGDILVYNSDQWISWMNPETYDKRAAFARSINMAGLSDWALDLNSSATGSGAAIFDHHYASSCDQDTKRTIPFHYNCKRWHHQHCISHSNWHHNDIDRGGN
ncbi:glycoside hydrolase family 18 protein [Cucurbitaria berberidis CBS 394.84]|uniref:chitinase n=1 Tax=Cucurbitaria berberidis CBS 394.84 TaxID=1168544 RepID=A0A9P4GAF4_9PLEO|nr:glycoside hydrolase family 18 protein [Cucurbitaria berberidis CBS 394.84]KAF1841659.1 glycoside hydrolase family 18 protein [Cucurbitaria berberidis CBS 394.84]